jgi:hypothetical protein
MEEVAWMTLDSPQEVIYRDGKTEALMDRGLTVDEY